MIATFLLKSKGIENPDEFFWQTLAFNPRLKAPGGCLAPSPPSEQDINYLARFVIWWGSPSMEKCSTKFVRDVCILGTPHIQELKTVPHLFANKFYENYQPEAYDDLESWYFSRARHEWGIEAGRHSWFSEADALKTYGQLQCSKYHLP